MEGMREMDDRDCESGDGKFSRWWKRQGVGAKAGIIIACVILGLGVATGLFSLFGHIVMWLWNWIMPYLFDLPTIDFWMAWGIVALSMILFGRASSSSESGSSRKRKKKIKASMKEMPTDGDEMSADGQKDQ
ncbi:MAG: hypothetical protein ABIJ86_08265 [Spirochaetota bacterium]